MSLENYICWTDSGGRRHYASFDEVMISVPGRPISVGSGSNHAATIFYRTFRRVSKFNTTGSEINQGQENTSGATTTISTTASINTESTFTEDDFGASDLSSKTDMFMVATAYEALRWVVSGDSSGAFNGTE